MTPLGRFVRGFVEKLAGTDREGPKTPARFGQYVEDFVSLNPQARRPAWVKFAVALADQAYRAGYVSGFEQREGEEAGWPGRLPPELAADHLEPDWRNPLRAVQAPEMAPPEDAAVEGAPDDFDLRIATRRGIDLA
jgi:hypothetical protein